MQSYKITIYYHTDKEVELCHNYKGWKLEAVREEMQDKCRLDKTINYILIQECSYSEGIRVRHEQPVTSGKIS